MFIEDHNRTGCSYLVVCDGIGQLLDESRQGFGILDVAQEPNKHMLFGERFKPRDNSIELPGKGISERIYTPVQVRTSEVHPSSIFLRDHSLPVERQACRITTAPSALSPSPPPCYLMFAGTEDG